MFIETFVWNTKLWKRYFKKNTFGRNCTVNACKTVQLIHVKLYSKYM